MHHCDVHPGNGASSVYLLLIIEQQDLALFMVCKLLGSHCKDILSGMRCRGIELLLSIC